MSLKIGIKLTSEYSFNFSLPKREKKRIKFIIIHYTGMKKESSSIKKLCDPKSKVSSHYYVKKNGSILNLVPDLSIILPVVWALLQSSSISSSVLPLLQDDKAIGKKRISNILKTILINYCIGAEM